MKIITLQKNKTHKPALRTQVRIIFVFASIIAFALAGFVQLAQDVPQSEGTPSKLFRTGEKLTYNVSFGKYKNAAFAETAVVSSGKLGDKNAIELRSRIKTNDFITAAFYSIDETRTTFAAADSGMPLYIRKTTNISGLPKTTYENFLTLTASGFDLLTLVFQARSNGGSGNFPLLEAQKNYTASFQNTGTETVVTDAGSFETSISTVACEFFVENGISDLKVNFSLDEARIPVLIRFKTDKGDFRAEMASVQYTDRTVTPTPTPNAVPTASPTPRPVATPPPYVENQPLADDLSFRLGEMLEFRVSANDKLIGNILLEAKDRKQFMGVDSLQLKATVLSIEPGNNILNLNDGIIAQVSPDSLAPQFIELRFTSSLSQFNQTAQFDQKAGTVTFNGRTSPDVPVGTHSLLSLAYAIRSFNLKPSRDLKNPVNDTRVAVFFDDKATVFTIRPSYIELLTFQNEKIPAQLISITTGNPDFDRHNFRVWLSADEKRTPLRLSAGVYTAELIRASNSFSK